MRWLRWVLLVILFVELVSFDLPFVAEALESPDIQTEWIDLTPPNGFSGGLAYPPINNRTGYQFRIHTLNGSPGYWQLWLTPDGDAAAYSFQVWSMDAAGKTIPGPSGSGQGDCGQSLKVIDVMIPNAEGVEAYLGVSIEADFIQCNEDTGRMTAISNFTLGWSYLGSAPPPTETPTPTISPTPGLCTISLTASPSHIPPGGSSTIHLKANGAGNQPLSGAIVTYGINSGPGMVGGGEAVTDAQGELQFEYQSPQDVGGASAVTIAANVSGCESVATVKVYLGASPTPTITNTPTPIMTEGTITGTPPITSTATPSQTPLPDAAQGEISIARIVLVQGIEGGELVGGRTIGVRTYFNLSAGQAVEIELNASVDGAQVAQKTKTLNRKNCMDLFLPASISSWGQDEQHLLEITATLLKVGGRSLNPPFTSTAQQTFETRRSRPVTVLYVSIDPFIGTYDVNDLASRAKSFFDQVYPIPYSARVRNAAYFVTPTFRSGLLGYMNAAKSVEVTRRYYNSQRCRDASGNPISPCTGPRADIAVGIFNDGVYGADTHGFAYRLFRNIWHSALNNVSNYRNVSHEIGHLYGLEDEYTDSSDGILIPRGNHSLMNGRIRVHVGTFISFMGRAGNSPSPTWVNANTWNSLLAVLRGSAATLSTPKVASIPITLQAPVVEEIEGKALMVTGVMDGDGHVEIRGADLLYRYEPLNPLEGEFLLQALDASGEVIVSSRFDLAFSDQYPNDDEMAPFLAILSVDDPDQVVEIRMLHGDQEVASFARSPSKPTVSFNPLPKLSGEKVEVSWSTSDADGDPLRSTLFYSSDGGVLWQVLGVDLEGTQVEIDPNILSGGESRFKVVVSDGLNRAEAFSDTLSIPDRAPMVTINLPWGDTFASDETVYLIGYGYDLEDGELPATQLTWQDGNGKEISQGPVLEIAGLPEGEHPFILSVVDSIGKTVQDEVVITVLPPEKEEGMLNFLSNQWKSGLFIASLCGWVLVMAVLVLIILFFKGQTWAKALMIVLIFLLFLLTTASGILGVVVFTEDGFEFPLNLLKDASEDESGLVVSTPFPFLPTENFQQQAVTRTPEVLQTSTPSPAPTSTASALPPSLPTDWQIMVVEPGEHVGEHSSLALDSRGFPHISYSYYSAAGSEPDYDLHAAHFNGDEWLVETIDSEDLRGRFTSLAYDGEDHPHIAYYDVYRGDLHYAYHDGIAWRLEAIETQGKVGYYASLAIDSSNRAHVGYQYVDDGDVRYASDVRDDASASWSIEDVDDENDVGGYLSLALDSHDLPHISYYDGTNGDLKYAYHDGEQWVIQVVDSEGDVGLHTSIELDERDLPHIAYFDFSKAALKYAHFDGTQWLITTVDSDGNVGRSASLALDSFGRPAISYFDLVGYNLKFALFDGVKWQIGIVGALGEVRGSEGTSLVLDHEDRPHIAYYTMEGLKYAYAPQDG
jgi:hypothetical protein